MTDLQEAPVDKPPMTPRGLAVQLVFSLLLIAGGIAVMYLGWNEVHRSLQLRGAKTHIQAEVTGSDVHSKRSGATHVVKYEFDVKEKTYRFADATGRRDLWASLPRKDWDEAKQAGNVDVVYNPDDPWVNAPAAQSQVALLDAAAGLLFGVLLVGLGVLLGASTRKR